MKRCMFALTILAGVAATLAFNARAQLPPVKTGPGTEGGVLDNGDRDEILRAAGLFTIAFNKGDARALASLWTDNGETRDATGRTFAGRLTIEKVYNAFFKANPGAKIEVLVKSIRFPAKDLAVEEGLLRHTRGPKDLPSTTPYVAVHAREGGQWRIALSSEGSKGQDRLEDLDWLLGHWTTKVKDGEVKFTFVRDLRKPYITGTFTHTAPDAPPLSGSIRISLDPETGQIRSWGFEDDGAHAQSLWSSDGKSWILDNRGVMADGTPTAARMILQRVSPDAITWRTVDRVIGETKLADTTPMRLTRISNSK